MTHILRKKEKELRTQRRNYRRGLYERNRKRKNDYLKHTIRESRKEEIKKPERLIDPGKIEIKVVKDNIFKRFFKWIYGLFINNNNVPKMRSADQIRKDPERSADAC